MAKKTGENIR